MNKFLRRILLLIMIVICLVSSVTLCYNIYETRKATKSTQEAAALVGVPFATSIPVTSSSPSPAPPSPSPKTSVTPEPSPVPNAEPLPSASPSPSPEPTPEPAPIDDFAAELEAIDFSSLYNANPDAVGWIVIPDTTISYPLMQGSDNEYYLYHAWDKSDSKQGSIYLDFRNDRGLEDFHSILYGHRISENNMFTPLKYYEDQSFRDAHPYVYIAIEGAVYRYEVFSAYEENIYTGDSYRLGLVDDAGQQAYIDYCNYYSVISAENYPQLGDFILTMSTCTNRGGNSEYRWVVQAFRTGEV